MLCKEKPETTLVCEQRQKTGLDAQPAGYIHHPEQARQSGRNHARSSLIPQSKIFVMALEEEMTK